MSSYQISWVHQASEKVLKWAVNIKYDGSQLHHSKSVKDRFTISKDNARTCCICEWTVWELRTWPHITVHKVPTEGTSASAKTQHFLQWEGRRLGCRGHAPQQKLGAYPGKVQLKVKGHFPLGSVASSASNSFPGSLSIFMFLCLPLRSLD